MGATGHNKAYLGGGKLRRQEHFAPAPKGHDAMSLEELSERVRRLEERVGSNEMATAISNTKMSHV